MTPTDPITLVARGAVAALPAIDPARAREAGRAGLAPARIEAVAHAIAAHIFSAGIMPQSLEARALQDSPTGWTRAVGAIGVARCFYTAGRMGSALYDAADPRGEHRALHDEAVALDHFRVKLLGLADGFQTAAGARTAAERTRRVRSFWRSLRKK